MVKIMKDQMLNLIKKENILSEEEAKKIHEINEEQILEYIIRLGSQNSEKIDDIKKYLTTGYIGRDIYYYDEILSTNSLAKYLGGIGIEEGTVIIAGSQTEGRGRSGKSWESPKGGGIWLSIIIKPDIPLNYASFITLASGVAVCRELRKLGVDAKIKWPNDILIHGKKVSGVLTEAKITFNKLDYVVVGIGIDTDVDVDELPESLKDGVTNLKDEVNDYKPDNEIIALVLNEFEKVYELFKNEEYETILSDWRNLSATIGSEVTVKQPLGILINGYALGINKEGNLIIEKDDGELVKIIAGELRHRNQNY